MFNYILCISVYDAGVLKSEAYKGFYSYELVLEDYIHAIKEYISNICDTIIYSCDGSIGLESGSELVKIYVVDVRKGRII